MKLNNLPMPFIICIQFISRFFTEEFKYNTYASYNWHGKAGGHRQCAAVKTTSSVIRDPPHRYISTFPRLTGPIMTNHGKSAIDAVTPPTIFC